MNISDTVDDRGGDVSSPFDEKFVVDQFFPGVARLHLLDNIRQDIAEQVSIVVVTGDAGSGKSAIRTVLQEDGFPDRLVISFNDSIQSFEDVVRTVAEKVGVEVTDLTRTEKAKALDDIAEQVMEQRLRFVLVCDGAEKIYLATLERIRKMLDKLNSVAVFMQVVLIGRELLLENLQQLTICNFDDVPERRYVLEPLSLTDTARYLELSVKRLPAAEAGLFTAATVDKIYRASGGNFQKILSSADAVLKGEDIQLEVVDATPGVLGVARIPNPINKEKIFAVAGVKKLPVRLLGIIGGVVVVGALAYLLTGGDDDKKPVAEKVEVETIKEIPLAKKSDTETYQEKADTGVDATPVVVSSQESAQRVGTKSDPPIEQPERAEVAKIFVSDPDLEKSRDVPVEEEIVAEVRENLPDTQPVTDINGNEPEEVKAVVQTVEAVVSNVESIVEQPLLPEKESQPVEIQPAPSALIEPVAMETTLANAQVSDETDIPETKPEPIKEEIVQEKQEIPFLRPERIKKLVKQEGALISEVSETSNIVISSLTSSDDTVIPLLRGDEEKKKIVKQEAGIEKINKSAAGLGATPQTEPIKETPSKVAIVQLEQTEIPLRSPQKVQNVIVPAVGQSSTDALYQRRLAAGKSWLSKAGGDKYTMQLMVLTSDDARENMNQILGREGYAQQADNFYIFENGTTPPRIYVFYGEYKSMTDARDARNSVPEVLKKHNPYVLSVPGAMRKVK